MLKVIEPDGDDIIDIIARLQPGESTIYHTGVTGWLEAAHSLHKLRAWIRPLLDDSRYIFAQRRNESLSTAEIGVYDYIAIRKALPRLVR